MSCAVVDQIEPLLALDVLEPLLVIDPVCFESGVPAQAVTIGGEVITIGGEPVTIGAAA